MIKDQPLTLNPFMKLYNLYIPNTIFFNTINLDLWYFVFQKYTTDESISNSHGMLHKTQKH